MAALEKLSALGQLTLFTSELMNAANGATIVGADFDNSQGQPTDGYPLCEVEFLVTFVSNPANNAACELYFCRTFDGSNYEGGGGVVPQRAPDVVLPLRVSASSQRLIRTGILLPTGPIRPLFYNTSGVALSGANVHSIKLRPYTRQAV